jgi:hypothetical protein
LILATADFSAAILWRALLEATISAVLSCVEQANPAGIFSLLGGVYLSVTRDCKRVTLFCSYGNKIASHLMFCKTCMHPLCCFCPGHILIIDCKYRDDQGQLLLGIRRVQRQQTIMPSSMLSSDSMHIGVLAAANHAATTNSRFTIFYNPRY